MQNILRDVILKSDNHKIAVSVFLDQLKGIIEQSSYVNSWIEHTKTLASADHQYFEIEKLIDILECLYWELLRKELTISIIDRDPSEIEIDLRKYLQHVMLHHAKGMKKFKKILIEKFSYIDPLTGSTIQEPNYQYMESIETVLYNKFTLAREDYRKNVAERILKGIDSKDIVLKKDGNIISSSDDNILNIFVKEHKKLLSNARTNDSLDTNKLRDAFFYKQNDKSAYEKCSAKIKAMCEKVINNMERNFGYSHDTALEAILYGCRYDIVQLSTIIKREEKDA
jgi:hypothetical protein